MLRSSGILLHISSLPSPYGIGTLGKEAYRFADFLKAAGQSYWQMLPLGQTSHGDSPYQSFSTFAGNPYFIDLDMLVENGLITAADIAGEYWGTNESYVDYGTQYNSRYSVLRKAYINGREKYAADLAAFAKSNGWVKDYALFMAVKKHFGMGAPASWTDEDIRLHKEEAVEKYSELLKDDVEFYSFLQLLFFRQWDKLKEYVNSLGIKIIGDLPIYVALDSADVWASKANFMLDKDGSPSHVAGVPPDYFSENGQLWGNPLYDWDYMKKDGYGWWMRRIEAATRLFDVIRIDHFRGFESYWSIPFGSETAKTGEWLKGPAMDFIGKVKETFPNTPIIAEDLGDLTEDVIKMVEDSGFPGMNILEFAFTPYGDSSYLPHNHKANSVCYTGTHDNTTVNDWFAQASEKELAFAKAYLGLTEEEGLNWGMIRGGMASPANLFLAQMQDYLNLPGECRMNTPGTSGKNWQWRMVKGAATDELAKKILDKTRMYGRYRAGKAEE